MSYLLSSILPKPRRPIVKVHPDVSVAECVALMVRDDIGGLVVMDDKELLGIVSERDIVRSLVHKGMSAESAKVADILCTEVSVLTPMDSVEKAIQVITSTRRRYILVTEEDELIAIVSMGDVLFKLLEDKVQIIEHLENYIHT